MGFLTRATKSDRPGSGVLRGSSPGAEQRGVRRSRQYPPGSVWKSVLPESGVKTAISIGTPACNLTEFPEDLCHV